MTSRPLTSKILLIGPRTGQTPMGVSIAFDMLADRLQETDSQPSIVNLTQRGTTDSAGRFQLGRTFFGLAKVVEAWFKMLFVSKVYLTVSTSVFGFMKDFLIIVGAWLLRKKIIIHLHGGGYRDFYSQRSAFGKRIIRWTLMRTSRIIVLGELLRNQFEFLDKPELVCVVPNGLTRPTDSPAHATAKNPPAPGEPWRFLYMSNLMETKGYFVLLQACEQLANQSKHHFKVDFCGAFIESIAEPGGLSRANDLQEQFLQRIETEPLKSFVEYHGTVSGSTKERLFEQAHALVLPTWYTWEGQPLSIIEAMSDGTLVISTQHAGIPEQIVDGETGWMLNKDAIDAEHLARLMESLMSISPDRYRSMSDNAIQFYLANFTREQHLNNLLAAIESAN